jgi:hypothetical protein
VHAVDQTIAMLAAKPTGREGTFGKMVFSHDLIHQIGGDDDTNGTLRSVSCSCLNQPLSGEKMHTVA